MSEIPDGNQIAPGSRRRYAMPARLRIPPNRFGVPLGLAGLATAWHGAEAKLGTSPAVPGAIDILAAVVLLVLGSLYAAQGAGRVAADLRDPVQAPFVAVPSITGMMLAAALAGAAFTAGRILVVIFLVTTVGVGGWLAGQWIVGDLDQASVHRAITCRPSLAAWWARSPSPRFTCADWPRQPSESGSFRGFS
jgi:tellurite resistance protein TehA-like permease